ncbi:unnamed protein product [Symbiodinium necroappetens]|uniref:Very-long-chain (3R)-3-hydroxyacyl-CoA dehydratase n=1 Tax=Symbiodinium necroappetens TaxID=1628268 RepID=A0A812VJ36_9DINO|nr:unnamed protein product [Symbiodinium necroappetens]
MRAFQRLTALLVSTHSHQTRSLLCWGRVRKLLQILAMAWLRVVNAIALAGWTWLLLHSVLPTCSGLVARDELAGQGLRARRALSLFGALQTYCYAEVAIIAYRRHCVVRSMKGVEQTVLGLGICVFRTTIAVFAIPKLDNAALNQVLLGGWALADVLRYIALLSKRPSLQLLRRIASAILFLVVATAEVWASWLTFDSLTLGVRRWMVVQMCVTTMGLPVGAYLFLKSARPEQQSAPAGCLICAVLRRYLWPSPGGCLGRGCVPLGCQGGLQARLPRGEGGGAGAAPRPCPDLQAQAPWRLVSRLQGRAARAAPPGALPVAASRGACQDDGGAHRPAWDLASEELEPGERPGGPGRGGGHCEGRGALPAAEAPQLRCRGRSEGPARGAPGEGAQVPLLGFPPWPATGSGGLRGHRVLQRGRSRLAQRASRASRASTSR